jgi:hypothetical protein
MKLPKFRNIRISKRTIKILAAIASTAISAAATYFTSNKDEHDARELYR